ncbi:MAG: hypothetical protein JW928_05310, partial [Candidatus Aureabacteria bacterium]|nr:hypothetical protein [Candidatus Auribacterota bacterium]
MDRQNNMQAMQMVFPEVEMEALKDAIELHVPFPLEVKITDNRTTMISVSRKKGLVNLRIHWMFLHAGKDVKKALVHFLGRPEKAYRRTINDFIRDFPLPGKSRNDRAALRPQGKYFDLRRVFHEVNREYFGGEICSKISFGKRIRKKRKVRYINLGYYREDADTIFISSRLDRREVPEIFVKFIVYHEMLHAEEKYNKVTSSRNRLRHTDHFRKR